MELSLDRLADLIDQLVDHLRTDVIVLLPEVIIDGRVDDVGNVFVPGLKNGFDLSHL